MKILGTGGDQAEREFAELLHQANTNIAETVQALRGFLGENDVMAYLTMMANRLIDLHRVLKKTGSLSLQIYTDCIITVRLEKIKSTRK